MGIAQARTIGVLSLLSFFALPSYAAEVRLRESLLEQQRDLATLPITVVADHIGDEAHGDLGVRTLGELKNPCS